MANRFSKKALADFLDRLIGNITEIHHFEQVRTNGYSQLLKASGKYTESDILRAIDYGRREGYDFVMQHFDLK